MYNLTQYLKNPYRESNIVCWVSGLYNPVQIMHYRDVYIIQYYDSADKCYRTYWRVGYSLKDCHHYIKSDIIPNLCKP